jgi:hypothetical protein
MNTIAVAEPSAPGFAPDRRVLQEVARDVSGRPRLMVDTWTVTPMNGGLNGATLYRISGLGRDAGERVEWSTVVKVRRRPDWDGLDVMPGNDWRRETLAYRSALLQELTGPAHGLIAARCYGIEERVDERTLWLEDLGQPPAQPLSAAAADRAAYRLGVFGGAFARPGAVPDHDWLGRGLLPMWLGLLDAATLDAYDASPWTHRLKPCSLVGYITKTILQRPETWQRPAVRASFPTPVAERLLRLWEDRHRMSAAFAYAPQTLVHGDVRLMNLFTRPAAVRTDVPSGAAATGLDPGGDELVAIDWEFVGRAALGDDLGSLTVHVARAASSLDEALRAREALFAAYVAGLTAAGWRGDPRVVRYVAAAYAALLWGNYVASNVAALVDERVRARRVGGPSTLEELEAQVPKWAWLTYFALGLADEARTLVPLLQGT